MNRNNFIAVLLLCTSIVAYGQQPALPPSGNIADSVNGQPVRYATVIIENSEAQPVKSLVGSDSGFFTLPLLPAGRYRLHIAAVGYTSKIVPIVVGDTSSPLYIGTLLLAAQNKMLAPVTVTAKPPLIRQEIDRLAFDVQADPESKVNNLLEMLRKVPLVTLDAEDNIQLKGSSNFRILINGKTSALVSGNVKEVLRTMPASTVEKIEVITIPPAKYEAEGLAGIINIVTTKKIDEGYKGTVNSYYRLPISGPGLGASFSMKKGKWGVGFSGGYNYYSAPEQQTNQYRETMGGSITTLQTNTRQVFDGRHKYGGGELSYAIDSLQLLTAEFNSSSGGRNFTNRQWSGLTDAQQQMLQYFQLVNDGANTSNGMGGGINYQLGFKKQKNRLLTFSYKYNRNNNRQRNNIGIADRFNYAVPDYRQFNQSHFTEQTLQADYVHPVNANAVLEAGIKGILRNNESDFRYLSKDSSTENYIEVPAFSNTFNNTQSVWGLYASFQYVLGSWSVKAGARMEATYVQADFIATASAARQHYFNIIPSLSVQRKYTGNTSLTVGFTQRIQRPGINQLNPFIDRSNPNFETTGNPGLRPVLSNNAEINFSRISKLTLVASLSYSFVNNNIQQAAVYQTDTKITRSFYDNIGKDKALAGNVSITWPVNARCTITMNGTLGYLWFSGIIDGRPVNNSGIKANLRTSVSYTFKKGWRITENLNYYAPFINLQGTTSHYLNPSLSVSKELKQFTFSFAAVNYFSTYLNYEQHTEAANFKQRIQYHYFNRSVVMSINYRFGKLARQLEKNKRGINNDDLSGN